jgi:DNA-binding LytR/AlgR family response regulator
VCVTAYDDRAAEAFDLGVADYVRKPVQADRIAESLRRVLASRLVPAHPAVAAQRERDDDPTIPVELAGTTRMLPRSSVQWVEAQGDYARLHTADGSHLVRVSLAALAERWADAGFVRVHRSYLVQLRLIGELRLTGNGYVVVVGGRELPVSRRHTRELKDRLVRAAKQQWSR